MKVFIFATICIACCVGASHRITGGQDAKLGEFPYQISMQVSDGSHYVHWCGGSIIAQKWILTAGHCVIDLPVEETIRIIAGIDNLTNITNGQIINVTRHIVHPRYPGGVDIYDVALIELGVELQYNKYVQPIALARSGLIVRGTAILSGWGSISITETPNYPNQLQKAELPLISFLECYFIMMHLIGVTTLNPLLNICTGNPGNHLAACNADSGGPLVHNGEVIGIVSWGINPCGAPGAPSVYTRVSSVLDFINEHVN